MNQLGVVLDDYPDIRLRELSWSATTPVSEAPARARRGDVPVMATVSELNTMSAVLTADIVPFNGDMRAAFARIDVFTTDLKQKTDFTQTMTVAYPFDASTSATLSGEIEGPLSSDSARFKVRLTYEPKRFNGENAEHPDESI